MADVRIDFHFTDGEMLGVDVHADAEHPDSLDELTARAVACFRQALEELTAANES